MDLHEGMALIGRGHAQGGACCPAATPKRVVSILPPNRIASRTARPADEVASQGAKLFEGALAQSQTERKTRKVVKSRY